MVTSPNVTYKGECMEEEEKLMMYGVFCLIFLLAIMKKTDRVIDIRTPAEVRRRHLGA